MHSLRFFESSAEGIPRVKICGVTRIPDAVAAIEAGADALGFNLWPRSKRFLPLEQARSWAADLPEDVARIAVVVDPSEALLREIRESGLFHAVQFHGSEPPDFCAACGMHWIKALPVREEDDVRNAEKFSTRWILLDTASAALPGGTGQTFNWEIARAFPAVAPGRFLILAGGLHAGNVAEAARMLQPHAVDTASGVESAPGIKDAAKMRDFVAAARSAVRA